MIDTLTSVGGLRVVLAGLLGVLVLWAALKGLVRLVLFAVGLAAGAAAAWAWWRWMPGFLVPRVVAELSPAFLQWSTAGAGLAGFLMIRILLKRLFSGERAAPQGATARLRSAGFGLVPAVLLIWGGAMAIRWAGAVGQLRQVEAAARAKSAAVLDDEPITVRLSRNLSAGWVGNLLDRTDPLSSRSAGTLCTIIYLHAWGHTYDQSVQRRLREQAAPKALLEHEAVRQLLEDRDVLHAISFSHFSEYLSLPEVASALKQPGVADLVLAIDPLPATRHALGFAAARPPRAQTLDD